MGLLLIIGFVSFATFAWILGVIFNKIGLSHFSDSPKPVKGFFFTTWIFFAIICSYSFVDCDSRNINDFLFYSYPGLRYAIMLLYFPLNAMLIRFLTWLDVGKREKVLLIFLRSITFLFTCLSIVAFFLLFFLAVFVEISQGLHKIGG